jgi:hypothetical protein
MEPLRKKVSKAVWYIGCGAIRGKDVIRLTAPLLEVTLK